MTTPELQVRERKKKRIKREYGVVLRGHKVRSLVLGEIYEEVNPAKAVRIKDCANHYIKDTYSDGSIQYHTNHCMVRLCPICLWYRSRKISKQLYDVVTAVRKKERLCYIFATFTVRNCIPEDLGETLDKMGQAFHNMMRRDKMKGAVKGWFRSTEITHNVKSGTFHPHLHVILAVEPRYFKTEQYISHEDLKILWQEALETDYEPQVDIRAVRGNTAKAVAEAAKYSVKSSDYIIPDQWKLSVDTVRLLDGVLHKRRFAAFGGILKEYHKKLNLDDPETGGLEGDDMDPSKIPVTSEYFVWNMAYKQYERV